MVGLLLAGENCVGRVPHDGMGGHWMGGHVAGLWHGGLVTVMVFFLDRVEASWSACGVLIVSLCCWGDEIGVVVDGF